MFKNRVTKDDIDIKTIKDDEVLRKISEFVCMFSDKNNSNEEILEYLERELPDYIAKVQEGHLSYIPNADAFHTMYAITNNDMIIEYVVIKNGTSLILNTGKYNIIGSKIINIKLTVNLGLKNDDFMFTNFVRIENEK